MEKNCPHCGTPLEDNALFCPECGEKVAAAPPSSYEWLDEVPAAEPETAAPEPAAEPAFAGPAAAPAYTEPVYAAPVAAAPATSPEAPAHSAPVPKTGEPEAITVYNKPLSTAAYFWTLFLFLIPGIGLIVMLIMAFTARNQNRRNFAQACLIYVLIALILLGLFMLVLVVSGKSFGIDISKFSFQTIWEGFLNGIGFVK